MKQPTSPTPDTSHRGRTNGTSAATTTRNRAMKNRHGTLIPLPRRPTKLARRIREGTAQLLQIVLLTGKVRRQRRVFHGRRRRREQARKSAHDRPLRRRRRSRRSRRRRRSRPQFEVVGSVSVDLARVRRGTHAARRTRVQGYSRNRHEKEVKKSQLGFSEIQSQAPKQMVKSQFFKYPLGNLRRKEYEDN